MGFIQAIDLDGESRKKRLLFLDSLTVRWYVLLPRRLMDQLAQEAEQHTFIVTVR
jgi:hypothetical protein